MNKHKLAAGRILLFCGTIALLYLLLVFAAAVPNAALRAHMEQSALSYRDRDAFSFENGKKWNGISDNYADSILLNISWNMGKGSPFRSALDTAYYDGEEMGENAGFYLAVIDETVQPNTDYTRYWHGYAAIVRLLHLVTDLNGLKWFGFVSVLLLAGVTVWMLAKHGHADLAVCLVLSMAAVQIWNIRLSIEYQPAFLVCFLMCPFYLWLERRRDGCLVDLSVVSGVCIAFFDFLTTETVTLLLPLLLVTAVRAKERRLGAFGKNFRLYVQCGLCWLAAYGGTFFVKWTAASLVTGENKYAAALSSVGERIGGSLGGEGPANPLVRIPAAVAANLSVMFGGQARVEQARVWLGLGLSVLVLGSVWYLFRKKVSDYCAVRLLAMLGAVVILRYLALNNHSYLHEFFTYRALVCPVFAALAGIALTTRLPFAKGKGR